MSNQPHFNQQMSSPKKILVIRLKQIGDALLSLPVCNSLRKTYPEAQIDYLVYQHIAPILEQQTAIDQLQVVTPSERNNKWLYFKKAQALRAQKYDLVVDLINVPISALITAFSGAQHTIGFDKKRWRAKLYKSTVPHRQRGDTVSKKLDILQGLQDPPIIDREWQLPVAQADRDRVKNLLEDRGVDLSKTLVFVAASSRRTDKLWPSQYMVTALNHLREQHNAQILFNWVPGPEAELVAELAGQIEQQNGVFADVDIPLRDLPTAISLCDFLFGNDGGPNHMAIGTGVPSLAIFAPFHNKESWLPPDKPKHQGVDILDALQIDHQRYTDMLGEIKNNLDDYYAKLKPELVLPKLDAMMKEFVD